MTIDQYIKLRSYICSIGSELNPEVDWEVRFAALEQNYPEETASAENFRQMLRHGIGWLYDGLAYGNW